MGYITCSSCMQDIQKWDYEITQLKDKDNYTCKKCKHSNSRITKICPICKKEFSGLKSSISKQTTCSYSCSNKLFRTDENNGNWKEDAYRTTCSKYHEFKCVVCGEDKIVEVHHFDHNHSNNAPENLIPLCPTHHKYMHSRFRVNIEDIVQEYKNNFKNG